MHEFAEEYVANLKPRDERYDTRLGDDFYVATFPNGIKTWVHVFEVNGFTRRHTLGIYPEMPLPQALESLYAARRTRAVETELAEQGMDGTQVRKTEDSPIDLTAKMKVPGIRLLGVNRRFLAGLATGSVLGLVAGLAVWMFMTPDSVAETPAQAVARNLGPPTVSTVAVQESDPVVQAPAQAGSGRIEPEMTVAKTPPPPATVVTAAEIAQQKSTAQETTAPETIAQEFIAQETVEQAVAEPVELSESQQALRKLQRDMAGTLAWAQLTSEVKNGEPIDQLSWVVELDNAPRQVFYFVRVRGMAGGLVTYRWRHKGKLLKEDAVRVGEGWHSPAYSGITLTRERLGSWQVEVYGPDGEALGSEEFETRIAGESAQLSRR